MNRRLTLQDQTQEVRYRRVRVSARISKESYQMLFYLASKYPGLYFNKSHVLECALRKLYSEHKKINGKVRQ